jgi:hypothetical protein
MPVFRFYQEELQRLSEQNSILKLRQSILTAYSFSLRWLRDQAAVAEVSGGDSIANAFSHDDKGDESQLIQQLQVLAIDPGLLSPYLPVAAPDCDKASSSTFSVSAGSCPAGQQPAAPEDDPLFLMHTVCAMPPFPGAADLTMQQVAAHYSSTVQQLALQLSLYRAEQRLPAGVLNHPTGKGPLHSMQVCMLR